MELSIKSFTKNSLKKLGYEITRTPKASAYPHAHVPYNPNTVDIGAYARNYPEKSLIERRFYNLGAGSFRHQYWTNIDLVSDWYSNQQDQENLINFDLFSLDPLPIESNCAEVVYTSHTVEHVSDAAVKNAFHEVYRILKPGGVFRITTPDTDLYFRAWKKNDVDFYYWRELFSDPQVMEKVKCKIPFNKASLAQIFLWNFASQISELSVDNTHPKLSDADLKKLFQDNSYEGALNYCTSKCTLDVQQKYPGWHMNWWNEAKARRFLEDAGFKTIYKSGYGQSASPVMCDVTLFDAQDPRNSLYMEAVKD